MKKILFLLTIFTLFTIGGCTQNNNFTIVSKEFTKDQNEILYLTGNRASKYLLKNLPKDKNYALDLSYVVYKGTEKFSEKTLTTSLYAPTLDKIDDTNISINIQKNKITIAFGGALCFADIDEDISKLSNYYFAGSKIINLGDEVYLFHGYVGEKAMQLQNLGSLSKDELDDILKANSENVFIKLGYREIK